MSYQLNIEKIARLLPIKEGKFLVTGATGLIGACIIDVLIAANEMGCNFTIFALCRSEKKLTLRFNNKVIPIIQSVEDPIPQNVDADYIFHCASNADPKSYAVQPVETILTNILGNTNVLNYCKVHRSTRLVMTSSFEVYGAIDGIDTYTEDMSGIIDQTLLRNGYPESKRCCELLLKSYVEEYGVNAVIARLSSVYGPTMKMDDSKAHAQFIRNALNGEDIVLKSKGIQKRSYSYVVDIVSALFTLLFKSLAGQIYNVAGENSVISIADLASVCAKLANKKVKYELPDDLEKKGYSKPQDCILDITKLKQLGWQGSYTVEEGIQETIEYLRQI